MPPRRRIAFPPAFLTTERDLVLSLVEDRRRLRWATASTRGRSIRAGRPALGQGRRRRPLLGPRPRARALLAALGAHSMLRLDEVPSAAFAVILAVLAHRVEWPIARGGSRQIAAALEAHVRTLGGRIVTGRRIANLDEPPASADPMRCLPPRHPRAGWVPASGATSAQARTLSTCSGVFKLDWALGAPIPWRTTACAQAATVHLGGSLEETEAAERDVASGRRPEWPFVILAQPSLFDPTRAPSGRHTAWAYCHVPNGSMRT
jgi:phytoene dehydrogenase-like protein